MIYLALKVSSSIKYLSNVQMKLHLVLVWVSIAEKENCCLKSPWVVKAENCSTELCKVVMSWWLG